jgi:uncharacterized PurR-regulated membrane protein YhhQ (DUF165 family)
VIDVLHNDDDEFHAELNAPYEPVADPRGLAISTSLRALLFLSIPAAGYLIRFHAELDAANWIAIASIPIGAMAACTCYALLAGRYGRRIARRAVALPLSLALVLGVYLVFRYLENR